MKHILFYMYANFNKRFKVCIYEDGDWGGVFPSVDNLHIELLSVDIKMYILQ